MEGMRGVGRVRDPGVGERVNWLVFTFFVAF